eukprot:SAG11_NODE_481_length_9096_cov_5.142381_4_plen_159_part_00
MHRSVHAKGYEQHSTVGFNLLPAFPLTFVSIVASQRQSTKIRGESEAAAARLESSLLAQVDALREELDAVGSEAEESRRVLRKLRQDGAAQASALGEKVERGAAVLRQHETQLLRRIEQLDASVKGVAERLAKGDDAEAKRTRGSERELREHGKRLAT